MKIKLLKDAMSGNTYVPAGDYMVTLKAEAQEMTLVGRGKDFQVKALKRRQVGRSKATTVTWSCGGGTTWSLVVSTPKQGEWIAMFDLQGSNKEKDKDPKKKI